MATFFTSKLGEYHGKAFPVSYIHNAMLHREVSQMVKLDVLELQLASVAAFFSLHLKRMVPKVPFYFL